MALHDILFLWQRRVVDSHIGSLHTRSVERTLPESHLPRHCGQFGPTAKIFEPGRRQCQLLVCRFFLAQVPGTSGEATGKSQVLIRAIHKALQREATVLFATPVALLAQGYHAIFGPDLACDTLHAAFDIPVHPQQSCDVNFSLNKFDMVVVDEASLVSSESLNIVAGTLNHLNCHPLVVIEGDKRQQQPLQTVDGRTSTTVLILNDQTFIQQNSVKHALHEQFRILDKEYEAFVEMVRYLQPSQQQLDHFQEDLVLCPAGILDKRVYREFCNKKTP